MSHQLALLALRIVKNGAMKGVTLLEIIISLIILSIIIAGLASVMVLGKRFILHSGSRMAGGELGRLVFDPLQMQVSQKDWATNCLGAGTGCPTGAVTIGGIDYNPAWSITPVAGTSLRRVSITWTWAER
jgi:prepilin-type N-terminal cleavage/methylation domain-containing protein